MSLHSLDTFHRTRTGHIVFGFVELAMSYGFASWALGNGSLWLWGVAFVLLLGTFQNFAYAIWRPKE